MNHKDGVIKRACFISLVLFSILGLTVFVGCGSSSSGGGGDGGAGGGTPTSFTTATLFPLSSGWETDKWTLFVDPFNWDINGILTKAMADTQGPNMLFWTNDAQGLRLHATMNSEGDVLIFPTPVFYAGSVCNLGDVKTGNYFIEDEEYNYTLAFVAVEDVEVPAGYFANCAKFELFVYPASELPSQYGTENFWLADGVGFVKGQADDNSDSELFTKAGETRQLLSYHLTPPTVSAEEQALREAYFELNYNWEQGKLDIIEAMIHPQYYDERCRDKDKLLTDWENFHNENDTVVDLVTLEDVKINGDEAFVIREELFGFVPKAGGEIIWDWTRVLRKWKKDGGEWKYFGAHTDNFRPDYLGVWSRHETGPGERTVIDAEFLKCGVDEFIDDPPNVIAALTVTGPPGSDINDLDLMPCWIGDEDPIWRIFWCPDELQIAVSGFYTFRVDDVDGDYFVTTDYLEAAPQLAVPVHVSPADGADGVPVNVTLDWDPVDLAESYRVDMRYSDDGGDTWHGMPNQYPVTPTNTQVTVNLNPDTDYRWRVRARRFDVYGEMDTESRSDWQEFATYVFILDSWSSMSMTGAPTFQHDIRAASVENELIVLAYKELGSEEYTGSIYDPDSESWAPTSMTGAPICRMRAVSVETKLIVLCLRGPVALENVGGIYDPGSDSWAPMSMTGAPSFEFIDFRVPVGTKLIVLGDNYSFENVGGIYDPGSDSWAPMSMTGAPSFDIIDFAVPVGTKLIVLGHKFDPVDPDGGENIGGIYDPGSDSWAPMSMTSAPSFKFIDFAVPVGTKLIVLGHKFDPVDPDGGENIGGIYDPGSDSWTPMSMTGAPSFEIIDFAVPVGTKLNVLGDNYSFENVGGIYDPGSDSWAPMSMTGAPSFKFISIALSVGTKLNVLGATHDPNDPNPVENVGGIYE